MRAAGALAVILGALCVTPSAGAASGGKPVSTLGSLNSTAGWSGTMDTGAVIDPSLCFAARCDTRILHVALPPGAFSGHPTGLLVAINWPDDQLDLGNDLDLYVYGPDGRLVASSTLLQYSTGEAAWVQDPANGDYRVVIVPRTQLGPTVYQGSAEFERGQAHAQRTTLLGVVPWDQQIVVLGDTGGPVRPLLPDLVPVAAHNFHMETAIAGSFYIAFDRGLRHPPSCYPQETTGLDADRLGAQKNLPLRCLRFDSDLVNSGAGPFEIRAYPNNGNGIDAWQAIYNSDGSYSETKAGQAIFSNAHGHVHFRGFDETGLYTINPDGTPGKLAVSMPDKGRCALDTHNDRFGQQGDTPMHYVFPSTCDTNANQDPADPLYANAEYFRSGISAGWDDEYPWFIPDQYIDVTRVPDGRYLIVDKVNVAHNVQESNYANDSAEACVEIRGQTASGCPLPARSASQGSPLPPPQLGRSVNATPVSGRVFVKLPGSAHFTSLELATQLPVGTIFDLRAGRMRLCSAHDKRGGVQCGDFYEGVNQVTQSPRGTPVTVLRLTGRSRAACGGSPRRAATKPSHGASSARSHRLLRRLWGNAKGRYRSVGFNAAASVRGTIWRTDDRCDGTLVFVQRGLVAVRDFRRHRTVRIHTGQQYLALR
jgi:hypothetical protein